MRIELPFIGQSYRHRTLPLSAQVTRNWYPEINPSTRAVTSLQPSPGLKSFCAADNVYTTVDGDSKPAGFWAQVWGKTVITVGPSGRDYTSIETALYALAGLPSGTGLLLVDDGTWTVSSNYFRFNDKSVVIKSRSGNAASCVLNFKIEAWGVMDLVLEGIKHVDLGGAVPVPIAMSWYGEADVSTINVTYSKCIVEATGYYALTSYGAAGSNHTITYKNTTGTLTAPANPGYEFLADTSAVAELGIVLENASIAAGTPAVLNCDKNTTLTQTGTNETYSASIPTQGTQEYPFAYYVLNKEYDRGLNVYNGRLYSVSGQTLYEIDRSGTRTSKGSIPGSSRCYFANESNHFIIVSGGRVFSYNGAVTEITSTNLESPQTVAYINRQAIYDGKNGRFWVSDVNNLGSIEPFNFASAEGAPDGLVRVYAFEQTLYLFGDSTVELWYNSGSGNPPLDRIEGGILDVGLAARASVSNTHAFIYFLGDDRIVYQMARGGLRAISNPALADELAGFDVSDAIGFCYTFSGQEFYQLTFPKANRTFCYSESSGAWFELSSDMQGGRHFGNSYAFCYGKHLMADYRNGNVYELDPDTFTDNGDAVRRVRDTVTIDGALLGGQGIGRKLFMRSFELVLNSGCGIETGQGSAPEIMMQFSDDGGRTWSPELWRKLGQLGAYDLRVNWHNLGAFNQRIIRVAVSDPVGIAIMRAAADVEVGW